MNHLIHFGFLQNLWSAQIAVNFGTFSKLLYALFKMNSGNKCQAHSHFKKGCCKSCKVCKYCPPTAECISKFNHKPWVKEQRLNIRNHGGWRQYQRNISPQNETLILSEKVHLSEVEPSNLVIIQNLLETLGCSTKVHEDFPQNGFKVDVVDVQNKN